MNTRYSSFKYGQHSGAFSLIELLIVIVILGVLFSVSLPSLQRLIARHHLMIVRSHLLHALSYAKFQALIRGDTVLLCGSQDGLHCDGSWDARWLLKSFYEDKPIHVFAAHIQNVQVRWRGNFKNRRGIYFDSLGETQGQQGRFVLRSGALHAELVLISSGRVR